METENKILYIEDNKIHAKLLHKKLTRTGYNVDIAFDSENGINKIKDSDYSVVFVDYLLPNSNGLNLISEIKNHNSATPVVMLTSYQDSEIQNKAYSLGASDFVVKDVDGSYLNLVEKVINQAIREKKLISENNNLKVENNFWQEINLELIELISTEPEQIAKQVKEILKKLGSKFKVAQSHIFKFEKNIFSLFSKALPNLAQEDTLGEVLTSLSKFQFLKQSVFLQKEVLIKNINEFSKTHAKEGKLLQENKINSLFAMPLIDKNQLNGYLILSNFDGGFSEKDLSKLRTFSKIFAKVLARLSFQNQQENLISELKNSIESANIVDEFLTICSSCRKIKDKESKWLLLEEYFAKETKTQFSHGICQKCIKKLYPEFSK